MSARRLLLVALALLAGCKNTSTRPSLRLNGPAAVAVYRGFSTRDAANLRTYLAVANERGDDLRILDAIDGQSVLAPALVQSLSVPTAPRPAMLAAGSLSDADPTGQPIARADLLVVASTGRIACDPARPTFLSGCVEVLGSWAAETALSSSLRVVIGDWPGGEDAAVLSLAVAPVPEPDPLKPGAWRAAAGRARVVAGLSGGRLLVVEYARGADDRRIDQVGAPAIHVLGFDPISLSVSPDPRHVYAASLDPIDPVAGVEGVAELDLSGAFDAAPAVRAIRTALPTSLPTTLVLAAEVRPFLKLGTDPALDEHGPKTLRVYAALDLHRCGRELETPCGLAVLDPVAGGPIADPITDPVTGLPAPELPAHAPIPYNGEALAITAVYPPALGSLKEDGLPATSAAEVAYQKQATATAFRWTSTLAALASSNGAIYLIDLARGAPALDRDVLASNSAGLQMRVASVISGKPATAEHPYLGLWDTRTAGAAALTHDLDVMPLLVGNTPGYTTGENWKVVFEEPLPGLTGLRAELDSIDTTSGPTPAWLALQVSAESTPGVAPFREVWRLFDPRLWIHAQERTPSNEVAKPGDVVVVTPAADGPCAGVPFELEVTGFLPADPVDHPGGAVTVTPRTVQPVDANKVTGDPACLGVGRSAATVTFRSGDLLVLGSSFGYAGRAPVAKDAAEAEATAGYRLAYHDTSAKTCAPLDTPGWPRPGDTCDQACRDACEEIYLSRRARRLFYVAEQCVSTGTNPDLECVTRWGTDPVINPRGPALAFKPGWDYGTIAGQRQLPARGAKLELTTVSGLVLTSRRPLSGNNPVGAALPSGLATYDRSAESGVEAAGVRVFGSYPSNLVLDFTPSAGPTAITVHK